MLRRFTTNYMLALYLADLGCGALALRLASLVRGHLDMGEPITTSGAWVPVPIGVMVAVRR